MANEDKSTTPEEPHSEPEVEHHEEHPAGKSTSGLKSSLPFILIGALVMIVVFMAGYILLGSKQNQTSEDQNLTAISPAVTQEVSPTPENLKPGWKTYTNNEDKYTVNFDDVKFVRMNCPGEGLVLKTRQSGDENVDEDKVLETCGRDGRFNIEIQTFGSNNDPYLDPTERENAADFKVTKKTVSVGGISGYQYTITATPACQTICPEWREETLIKNNNKNYVFFLGNENNQEIFDEILSTFKFID